MTSDKNTTKAFWIDLLCWGSALKTIALLRHLHPEKIHYVNVSHSFRPFISSFERLIKIPLLQARDIAASEEKLEGVSLYETIQMRIEGLLNAWLDDKPIEQSNDEFCRDHNLHPDKFDDHLKEAAYAYLYRPVELGVWAEYVSGKDKACLILRRTPFAGLLARYFEKVVFYRSVSAHVLMVEDRPDFYYDRYLNKKYFSGRFRSTGRFLCKWMANVIASVVYPPRIADKKSPSVRVGVEFTQSRIRRDEINDISWMESSGLNMEHICGLEMDSYDDESIGILKAMGIPRYKIVDTPVGKGRLKGAVPVTIDPKYIMGTMIMMLGLVRCLLIWNEASWLRFQRVRYIYRSFFWLSVYEQLGIKVLFTMCDVDEDKLAKGQALEWLDGLLTGGHWSNFPMYRIDNQKCLDVLFTWGEHFVRNNFNRYPYMAIFFTGYPCDYYFKVHREIAAVIRKRHEGKFILSYHDNIMGQDLPYSKHMQLDIHRMLISLLRKFENVVLLLKPKRKFVLDEIIRELPELQEMISLGRVEIFLGDTARTKAVPAQIGMASDLVVGLGISTTAAESFFAGTVSFHADLTGFERNEFANRSDGVVVFRDLFTLEKAIIARITGSNKWKYDDFKGYYMGLDPFMDGYASKRMGYLIKRMREYLEQGVSREDLLPKISRDYDSYLLTQSNWQKMSWN